MIQPILLYEDRIVGDGNERLRHAIHAGITPTFRTLSKDEYVALYDKKVLVVDTNMNTVLEVPFTREVDNILDGIQRGAKDACAGLRQLATSLGVPPARVSTHGRTVNYKDVVFI